MSINSINGYGAAAGASSASNTTGKTKSNSTLSMDDFFKLMVAQLSNQDMYNTVDDSQFMAQMAQFSMVQALSDLSELSMTSYGVSLIGKEVTVAKVGSNGELNSVKGIVEGVNFYNGSTQVIVDGGSYSLSSVMAVSEPKIIIPDETLNTLQTTEPINEDNTTDKTENNVPTENNTTTDNSSPTDSDGSPDAGSTTTDETDGGGGV